MNRQIFAFVAATITATTAHAIQESNYYQGYFEAASVQHLMTQTQLYNEENGYWDQPQIMNQELVRYLNQVERNGQAEIAAKNEVFGYWQ